MKYINFGGEAGRLFKVCDHGKIVSLELDSGRQKTLLKPTAASRTKYCDRAVISRDGRYAALLYRHQSIQIWQLASQPLAIKKINLAPKNEDRLDIRVLAISPDSRYLLSGDEWGAIRVYETASGRQIKTLQAHRDCVSRLVFSPDGKYFVSVGQDMCMLLWETASFSPVKLLQGHYANVRAVVFSADGRLLISASHDRNIIFWEMPSGRQVARLVVFPEYSDFVITTPQGYFDGSARAIREQLHFVQNNRVVDFDPLAEQYYRPGLLAEVLGKKSEIEEI